MVPRAAMQVTKNPTLAHAIFLSLAVFWLAGCTPPGPRALLEGKQLLEAGQLSAAVERLSRATQLMATNAQAWNYLGLARHQSGDPAGALQAYQQALRLDRELFEAHFNLGCLWLDQNKPDAARNEFTACTLRQPNAADAWLKLGVVQTRLGEFVAAEASLQRTLRLNATNPEARNALGLLCAQRKRPHEAVQHFTAALKLQANYRPALLNLATVLNRDLNDPAGAAKRYREYLALQPRDGDWESVNGLLRSIEQRLQPTPRPPATNASLAAAPVTPPAPKASNPVVAVPSAPRSNPPPVVSTPAPAPTPVAVAKPAPTPEVVRIETPPPAAATPQNAAESTPVVSSNVVASAAPAKPEKAGFFSRLNPFRREPKTPGKVTALPPATNVVVTTEPVPSIPAAATPTSGQSFTRYTYLRPTAPPAGDRAAAETAMARGTRARAANRLTEAAQAYQSAVDSDAGFYEARYQLALVQYALRDYPHALANWETALALKPDSADARYGFALTLKAAGHVVDAAAELEQLLANSPSETRAHLVLGNLYAEQLQDKPRARVHYQRVLELDSRHPQATQIRYWLVANPA